MPTLTRLIILLLVLAGIVFAGMWVLATFVEPVAREMSVDVPFTPEGG